MNTEKNEQKNPELTLPQIIEQSFDFSSYDPEEKKAIIEETSEMVMESTMLRLLNDAPEDVQEKFGALVESESDESMMSAFLQENFPNFGEVLVDEVKIFKSMGEEVAAEAEKESNQ